MNNCRSPSVQHLIYFSINNFAVSLVLFDELNIHEPRQIFDAKYHVQTGQREKHVQTCLQTCCVFLLIVFLFLHLNTLLQKNDAICAVTHFHALLRPMCKHILKKKQTKIWPNDRMLGWIYIAHVGCRTRAAANHILIRFRRPWHWRCAHVIKCRYFHRQMTSMIVDCFCFLFNRHSS